MAFNILIVDDSSPMRAVIKKTLKVSGFNIGQFYDASNGNEALDVLNRKWVDLVLTDYNMPDMDGLDLMEEMKDDDVLRAIPIVMITTEGSEQKVIEFMEKGAADYIKKPFAPEEIRQKLNIIMGEDEDGEAYSDRGDEELDF